MNLTIRVIPGARKNMVKEEAGRLKVYVTAPAIEGKANEACTEVLALHFKVRARQIEIIKGLKSRNKTVTIIGI
jgi:uncharacterized protein (TIGR00251 family)